MERHAHGIVAFSDVDTRAIGWYQRAGDPEVFIATQQSVGVAQPEREADDRSHRTQGDVPLPPCEAHAQHFLAAKRLSTHDSYTLRRGGVAASLRTGERETRDVFASGKPRQVVLLLIVGAVVQDEFRRAERVRDHYGYRGRDTAARQLHDDCRVRRGRETEPAVLLRHDHAEEAVLLDEVPGLRREVTCLHDLPLFHHRAQFFDGTVEEGAFFWREVFRFEVEELAPVRIARKEIAVPPHCACLERDSLGVAYSGQHRFDESQDPPAHENAADRRDPKTDGGGGEHYRNGREAHDSSRATGLPPPHERECAGSCPGPIRQLVIEQR